ncbi:hypothetical protein FALCPG4_017097 [Fusarium falciforme]
MSQSQSQSAFPHPNGMSSFWRSQTGELDEHRSTPGLPDRSDVVIVGAGYSGAALATHLLAKRGDRIPSILVLEARQLCSGATGRNGGHLKPDSYYSIAGLAKEYGLEAAAEVANFEAANIDAVADFIRDQDIDCDFVLTRAIDVQLSARLQDDAKAGYDLLKEGVEATKKTFCSPPEFAERLSGVRGAKGCFSYTAGHLWPYKLIHHAFRKVVEGGVNLQTNTPVQAISAAPDQDGLWTVTTARGVVKAAQVVMATNAYTAAVLPVMKPWAIISIFYSFKKISLGAK